MKGTCQNRLVGIIFLITLGSIILLSLLKSERKYHQNNFTTISSVHKSSNSERFAIKTLDTYQLPIQMLKELNKLVENSNKLINTRQPLTSLSNISGKDNCRSEILAIKTIKTNVFMESNKVVEPHLHLTGKPILERLSKNIKLTSSTNQKLKEQTWIVQLGAFKNTNKVLEIVDKIRLAGYHIYTLPSVPVQGQVTRIFVGPDTSKERLQNMLIKLNQLSGLDGQLKPYHAR